MYVTEGATQRSVCNLKTSVCYAKEIYIANEN
jgi:hypothetical protein